MEIGLGLYRQSLTDENLRFAQQIGVTHIIVHLVDYFGGTDPQLSRGDDEGWGRSVGTPLWDEQDLIDLKKRIEAHGMVWAGIENFDPAHWHDVLLDGPKKKDQLDDLCRLIEMVGRVGVPVIGYNFSLAGVWGWERRPVGRGGAMSVCFDEHALDLEQPIPNGMVWNMVYDDQAGPGTVPPVSSDELWQRLSDFLQVCVPAAEAAGVRLAAHPDDPPMPALRQCARLVNQPKLYQRLLDIVPSKANALEMCLGSLQETSDGGVLDAIDQYAAQDAIGYVHFRNVRGTVPEYQEVFIDEGDLDMAEALRRLHQHNYSGVLIPDHTPELSCSAPWHAGMAYAIGYMRALRDQVCRG